METQNESIREVEEFLKNKELIKENKNMSEIENFISDYKTLEDWEKSKGGSIWKEKFETMKKEYEKISGKKFVSFKETKSEIINLVKNETSKNKKRFCELRKETEPVAQKINDGDKFYFVFQENEFYFINNVGKTLSDASGSEIADFLCGKQK